MRLTLTPGGGISSPPTTTIDQLPPELLGIIFTFVHEDVVVNAQGFNLSLALSEADQSDDDADDEDDDSQQSIDMTRWMFSHNNMVDSSRTPSFFPYGLAAVCDTWKNVLSATPTFWTRLVLFVDYASPTPVEDARKYLSWSRQLPISVMITRRYRLGIDRFVNDVQSARVNTFISLLHPHMARCRSFHLDVEANSSVPALSRIVPNNARLLKLLSLSCRLDTFANSEGFTPHDDDASSPGAQKIRLKVMSIDGRTFHCACIDMPTWFEYQPQLEYLAISQYNTDDHRLPLATTLRTIEEQFSSKLSTLSFMSLNFEIDTIDLEDSSYGFWNIRDLYLDDIQPELVAELFRVSFFPRLHVLQLQRCSALDKKIFNDIDSDVRTLCFSNPPSEFADSDMCDFLSSWRGLAICFTLWKRPHDELLVALAEERDPDPETDWQTGIEGGKYFMCPNLHFLIFVSCPIPSFTSLKKLIESRNHYVNYDDPEWRNNTHWGPAISKLSIKYCLTTSDSVSSKEEWDWISQRVDLTFVDGPLNLSNLLEDTK
ncbi:hypothetical protein GALMADRAFT_239057 [Galerina marginata CBS 339.88]|uniref:F-box domain-containing protein n=1 Tax=Galerina marginata (strain CBS 339.88) TaxID=685588 RepID=A0A067TJ07_GALM3|nr:hypothetical protein GALMADRAFT_239057 [Galerina marginata CBS 339.88]